MKRTLYEIAAVEITVKLSLSRNLNGFEIVSRYVSWRAHKMGFKLFREPK